jgi:hypothetical protein
VATVLKAVNPEISPGRRAAGAAIALFGVLFLGYASMATGFFVAGHYFISVSLGFPAYD